MPTTTRAFLAGGTREHVGHQVGDPNAPQHTTSTSQCLCYTPGYPTHRGPNASCVDYPNFPGRTGGADQVHTQPGWGGRARLFPSPGHARHPAPGPRPHLVGLHLQGGELCREVWGRGKGKGVSVSQSLPLVTADRLFPGLCAQVGKPGGFVWLIAPALSPPCSPPRLVHTVCDGGREGIVLIAI